MSHQKVTMRLILLKKRVFNASERYKNLSKNSYGSIIFDHCLFILLFGEFKFLVLLNCWYFPIAGVYCVYLPNNSKIKRKINHGGIMFLSRFKPPLEAKLSDYLYQLIGKDGEIKRFRFKIYSPDLQMTPLGCKNGERLLYQLKSILEKERIIVQTVKP